MEKIKLPKEVAEAIESLIEKGFTKRVIVTDYLNDDDANGHQIRTIRNIMFETLLDVLVNGYEVEQTPEDKVMEYIDGRRK